MNVASHNQVSDLAVFVGHGSNSLAAGVALAFWAGPCDLDGNQTSQKHWRDWTRGWTLDIPKAMKGVCEDSLRRQNLRTGLCRQFMETVYVDKVQAECHEQAV